MKKIDLNFDINNIGGSKYANAGELVAGFLAAAQKVADPIKFYDWALKLYKGEVVTVDSSDFKKLKEFVENHEHLQVVAKAPILKYLEELKELE